MSHETVRDEAASTDPAEAAALALAAKKTWDALITKVHNHEQTLVAKQEKLASDQLDVESQRQRVEQDQKLLANQRSAVAAREEVLREAEEALAQKEAEAVAGFLARRDEILGPVREQIQHLVGQMQQREHELLTELDGKLAQKLQEFDDELGQTRSQLVDERKDVADHKHQLRRLEVELERRGEELDSREAIVDERESDLDASLQEMRGAARREVAAELDDAQAAVRRHRARLTELERAAQLVEQFKADLGDPAEVATRLEWLDQERQRLAGERDARPETAVRDELDAARHRLDVLEHERDEAQRHQRELEQQVDYLNAELKESDLSNQLYETQASAIGGIKAELERLQQMYDQMQKTSSAETAFPECHRMVSDRASQVTSDGQAPGDLKDFVGRLQLQMAFALGDSGPRLDYRLEDLRIFLAGLAMSRLHLLEGVSGTGKTTLPHAFAQAVRGGVQKIEVQAGWHDKQDLLGYYNSFERIYRETACLQFLYKAGLPAFEDRLIFIVLDEMNLSHPEQYFGDFLSALEDPKERPLISLVDRSLPDVPKPLRSDTGVRLPLAPNVWFIGTANQDETTFGFAPKTYDRAHVMELEPNAPSVDGAQPTPPERVSYHELMAAFDLAGRTHHASVGKAQGFIAKLEPFFHEHFRVGWGHRLNTHASKFIPVDVAAGGSLGEALDHIVATKVMKKIAGRHTLRRDPLEKLRDLLDEKWPDAARRPTKSLAAIASELDNLTFG